LEINMNPPGRNVQFGVGLIDTLVALTLLALSLLGASTALIRTLGANRAAALQTTAVDLAADLAEDLRAGIPVTDWSHRVAAQLPGANPVDQGVTGSTVTLRWWDPAIHAPTDFELPLARPWPGTSP
jgi:Tfp pilus assembly protein PilV